MDQVPNNNQFQDYKISIFRRTNGVGNEMFIPDDVHTFSDLDELAHILCRYSVAPGIFRAESFQIKNSPPQFGMHRHSSCFIEEYVLGVDYDFKQGCTLEKIFEVLKRLGYAAIVVSSKSHQRYKHKGTPEEEAPCDRFHVFFILNRPIRSVEEHAATLAALRALLPPADSTTDPARFFWASPGEVCEVFHGKLFPVHEQMIKTPSVNSATTNSTVKSLEPSHPGARGKIPAGVKNFLRYGAKQGEWHNKFIKACRWFKQQGYPKEEAAILLRQASPQGELDEHDWKHLNDIYANREVYPMVESFPFAEPYGYESSQPTSNNGGLMLGPLPNIEVFKSEQACIAEYEEDKKLRLTGRQKEIPLPFIWRPKLEEFRLPMGLTLIAGMTTKGKTTTSANIVATFITRHPDKIAVVIINEETREDFSNRLACLMLGKNFELFRDRRLSEQETKEIEDYAKFGLAKNIKIVRNLFGIEEVVSALESVADKQDQVGLVVLDYLQTINHCTTHPWMNQNRLELYNYLGDYLKNYSTRTAVPVVIFAQLHPESKQRADFQVRVQYATMFLNHAVAAIEIIPNFDTFITEFRIHKSRFHGDWKDKVASANFIYGKYEAIKSIYDIRPIPTDIAKEK